MTKRTYRTIDQVDEEYYRDHPEKLDSYLETVFETYTEDSDTTVLLSSLRMAARVKGISNMASENNITRNGIQKALSAEAKPRFDTINTIMKAMGYGITVHKLPQHTHF